MSKLAVFFIKNIITGAILTFLIILGGCSDDSSTAKDEVVHEIYSVCDNKLDKEQFKKFIDGNLVVVAGYQEHGYKSSKLVTDLFLNIVMNGIDFSEIDSYEISFDKNTGYYTAEKDGAKVGFTLFFQNNFKEEFLAGDFIPYNVFDYKTFIQNISIKLNGLRLEVTYDPGPLFSLVFGDVKINSLTDIKIKINTLDVAIEINSERAYPGSWEFNKDDLLIQKIKSTRLSLAVFSSQLDQGGVGMDFSGTSYQSEFFGVEQLFSDSLFLIRHEGDVWYWVGDYSSEIVKDGLFIYQYGVASNVAQNYTDYFCDQGKEVPIGRALHDLDLTGGTFQFENGEVFRYGMSSY